MTLDEAIEVYEFWANAHERDAEYHRPLGYSHEAIANVAEGQAKEERQVAEWLKELKAYRETYPYGVEGYPPRAETNSSEKPNNCDTCRHNKLEWYSEVCDGCSKAHSNYEPQDEPQTELVNDSPILVKDLVDDELNPYDEEWMRCKHLKLKCEFIPTYCKFEPRDEPQTDCAWK